jgi:hypothetical protein
VKKTCQAAAKPTAAFSIDFARPFNIAERLYDLRAFFVIALTIPFLVGLRWITYSHAAARQGVIPQMVSELKVIKQQAEGTASYGYQRRRIDRPYPTLETEFVRKSVTPSDYEEARRRYESVRRQTNGLIDKLKSTAPRGFTQGDVADIKRDHRPLCSSFVHFCQWVHGPREPGKPVVRHYHLTELPRLVQFAQEHNNRLDQQQIQELEACKLVPWQLAVR